MARLEARLAQNAPGDLFVDDSCIDCGVCRYVAPRSFARADDVGLSFVRRQPAGEEERWRALMALVACPTASIGVMGSGPPGGRPPLREESLEAARAFLERFRDDCDLCGL